VQSLSVKQEHDDVGTNEEAILAFDVNCHTFARFCETPNRARHRLGII
jgi:hypothetical protein